METVEGEVLSARAFELATEMHEKEDSNRGEAASAVQGALDLALLVEEGKIPRESKTRAFTDSKVTVDSTEPQVNTRISITKQSKSSMKAHMQNFGRVTAT